MFLRDERDRVKRVKRVLFVLAIVVSFILSLNLLLLNSRKDAKWRTTVLYTALIEANSAGLITSADSRVIEDLVDMEARFGRVSSFAVSHCISQISTYPSICTVKVTRDKGSSIEKLYWYGHRCLKLETEVLP